MYLATILSSARNIPKMPHKAGLRLNTTSPVLTDVLFCSCVEELDCGRVEGAKVLGFKQGRLER